VCCHESCVKVVNKFNFQSKTPSRSTVTRDSICMSHAVKIRTFPGTSFTVILYFCDFCLTLTDCLYIACCNLIKLPFSHAVYLRISYDSHSKYQLHPQKSINWIVLWRIDPF
jgi:hypothetical protein